MTREDLVRQIRSRLIAAYHDRLRAVVLYGSEARGETGEDSDVDILVLLDGPLDYGRDLQTNLDALYPVSLQLGRRISAKPILASDYERLDCPLFRAARREGIVL